MNKMNKKILSMILIAAMIMITAVGCNKKADTAKDNVSGVQKEAKYSFEFYVVDREGQETKFDISTDKETVGEALLDEKLIEGTSGPYGLYVTKVNGIEAIYENDGTYWSFYINDEYAMTGVDSTQIENGAKYSFKVEK